MEAVHHLVWGGGSMGEKPQPLGPGSDLVLQSCALRWRHRGTPGSPTSMPGSDETLLQMNQRDEPEPTTSIALLPHAHAFTYEGVYTQT